MNDRRVLRMWRPLDAAVPEPVWPGGVTVRTYADTDGEHIHALLDDAYTAWDDEYVPRAHDEWLAWMTQHDEFDPELWFLVERDGELVACALHWHPSSGDGWLKDLAVLETERGRGLGTALVLHGLRAYAKLGATRVGLKAESANPTGATQLYERLGFVVDEEFDGT